MPIYIKAPILLNKFAGCTLWPFILIKSNNQKNDLIFINHERIHLRQQLELLVLPFYIWYGLEYLYYRIRGNSKDAAYKSICFEKEAYINENDLYYLKQRSFWTFLKWM